MAWRDRPDLDHDDEAHPARPRIDPEPLLRPTPPGLAPPPRRGWLSPLNRRRWENFKANRRAYWSLWLFLLLYGLRACLRSLSPTTSRSSCNTRAAITRRSSTSTPRRNSAGISAPRRSIATLEVQCLIVSGGLEDCWDDPEGVIEEVQETGTFAGSEVEQGWLIWPLIPYSYNTVNDLGRSAPSPPDGDHWLGTDDTARDVLARVIYGFRLSVSFALVVTFLTSVIGIAAGAAQGYYGGVLDLIFQRIIEDLEFHAQPLHQSSSYRPFSR